MSFHIQHRKGLLIPNGKKNYKNASVEIAIGLTEDNLIMGGPPDSVKKHCKKFVLIAQGKERTSRVAKEIQKKIGGELDDIIKVIPAGGVKLARK